MRALPQDAATIRDTIADVFRAGEYNPEGGRSLGSIIQEWLFGLLGAILDTARRHPIIGWTALGLLIALAVAFLARLGYVAYHRARLAAEARLAGGAALEEADPLRHAQQLAKDGNYTEAAHALYRFLLQTLSRRKWIRLHPSKTVGDYGRELRPHSAESHRRYHEFARTYEYVIYGTGFCDRDRYDRLFTLVQAVKTADG